MWNRRYIRWMAMLCLLLTMGACKTRERVVKQTATGNSEFPVLGYETISTKSAITFNLGGAATTLNATLRIKRDSIILISIQPLAGFEVARAAMTSDKITLVNRLNKTYTSLSTTSSPDDNLPFLTSVEALLTNRPFLLGVKEAPKMRDFSVTDLGEMKLLQATNKEAVQEFTADKNLRIQTATLNGKNGEHLRCSYSAFEPVTDQVEFPNQTEIQFSIPAETLSSDQNISLAFTLSHKKIEIDKSTSFSNPIPDSYTQVTTEEFFKSLTKK